MATPIKPKEAHASGRRIEILAHMSQFKNPFMLCCFRWNRCFSTPDKVVRYANRTKKVTLASSPRRTASHKKGGRLPPFSIVFGQRSVGFVQLQ